MSLSQLFFVLKKKGKKSRVIFLFLAKNIFLVFWSFKSGIISSAVESYITGHPDI